ncbi:MAG: hypothetical protein AYK19_18650 [Theionarchaea archaeon DG-70-1]|nr:MAG: hypothetical protein AYK19_18650 [Theionarchaea archaeon DG-70-1]
MEIEKTLTQYLHALQKGSYEDIIELFAEDAVINSPLYGKVKASHFYEELLKDTQKSEITLLNIFFNESRSVGAVHFLYKWILNNGKITSFECVDIVEFSDNGKIRQLTIIYDTYGTREGFEKMKE